jgi:GNAT superfamily N-acetyltransferase
LYETSPGGRALTWLAIAPTGEVAGCTSFFPFRLWLDGEIVRAALGGDGYVRPKFRRRGLGGLLHDASRLAMRAHDIGCMYGAPGAMNLTPLKHGGSREVGLVTRWARPLKLPGGLERLVRPRGAATLSPMARDDRRVDAVWAQARTALRLAAVRDAAFYTWRFLDAPAGREPPYVIERDDVPIGTCAIEKMGPNMRIVDISAVPGAWHACLGAIVAHVGHTQARLVDIKLFSLDGRTRHMWRSGFVERDSKPFLVMIPKDGDRRFLDPQRWFYGGADSDLDALD